MSENKPSAASTSVRSENKITSSVKANDTTTNNLGATTSSNAKPTQRRGSVSIALNVGLEKEEELLTQWVIELLNAVTGNHLFFAIQPYNHNLLTLFVSTLLQKSFP